MKKMVVYFISFVFVMGCSPSKKELYEKTDAFVQSLETTYESYGILGGKDYSKTTSDGLYTISPDC